MSTLGFRKCCQCGHWFRPEPRNAYHQRFCSTMTCRAASKRASQQKWCRKNPRYFCGSDEVQRVQVWRRQHPGYWRHTDTIKAIPSAIALQDICSPQPLDEQLVHALSNRLSAEIAAPLQDVLLAQQHTLVGLAALLTGGALQEDIAAALLACYERGQRIGGMVPWMRSLETVSCQSHNRLPRQQTKRQPSNRSQR